MNIIDNNNNNLRFSGVNYDEQIEQNYNDQDQFNPMQSNTIKNIDTLYSRNNMNNNQNMNSQNFQNNNMYQNSNPKTNRNQPSNIPQEEKSPNEEFLNSPILPERTLSSFYGKDFLSDAILKTEEFEIPFHKLVLCSASNFLNKYFNFLISNPNQNPNQQQPPQPAPAEQPNDPNAQQNPQPNVQQNVIVENKINGKDVVKIPEILSSYFSKGNKKDCMEKLIKYCYYNQDIKSIESEITQYNCFTMLELSHCLDIKSLNTNLEKLIIKNFVNNDNMVKLAQESKNFELPNLYKECIYKIKKNLGKLKSRNRELTELNFDSFKDIISSDEIDVEDEKEISDLVIEYIKSRREIPEEKPPEVKVVEVNNENNVNNNNQPNPENANQNPPAEQKPPEENKPPEQNPPAEQKPPEENQQNQPQNNDLNKKEEKKNDCYSEWHDHLEEIKKNSKKVRLTPEQEKALVLCIRFSYLSHTDLIALTNEPIMSDYKDLILQGLSARLNTYENTNEQNVLINLTGRHYLRGPQISHANQVSINENQINNNMNQPQNQMFKSTNPQLNNYNQQQNLYDSRNMMPSKNNFLKNTQYIPNNNNYNINDINMNVNNRTGSESFYEDNNNNNNFNNNNNNSNYMSSEIMNIDEMNSKKRQMANLMKSAPYPRPPQDPRISEDFFKYQSMISRQKPIFKYSYDFDENGALYYLGTKGKRHQYRNPHEINMVKVFASSVSKGDVSAFVGRNLVNLRTENEENSFFLVDLGENRTLVPTVYSLRNRNSSSHVMLCWNLEASNDKINFEILDTRIFCNSNNSQLNKKLEKERNLLKEPGCTSSWGISRKIREKFPEGFRYFMIKQIDRNSNGSYNLAISGFELYGEGKGKGWYFN